MSKFFKENRINILNEDAVTVAQTLIGWHFFTRENDGTLTGGIITETEAYTAEDAASHSFRGKTTRNEVMFGPAGYMYVYFTYGMHWCANIVTGDIDSGQAVLIRALNVTHNTSLIRKRRAGRMPAELTNGPAKLCQALGISGVDNGRKIDGQRFVIIPPHELQHLKILATPRIGITRDIHRLWRFILLG